MTTLTLVKTTWPQREPSWHVEARYDPLNENSDQQITVFYPIGWDRPMDADMVDPGDLGFNGKQCDSIWDAIALQYEIDQDAKIEGGW